MRMRVCLLGQCGCVEGMAIGRSSGMRACMSGVFEQAWGSMHGQSSWGVCMAGAPEPPNFETQTMMSSMDRVDSM